jgi:MFS family permease
MRAPWIAPLAAALLMQTVGSFMNQVVPVVAPRMTADLGLPAAMVGNFSSLTILGSIVFLLFGTPLVAAFGPARLLQCGVLTGASALALAALGEIWLLPVAALLLGMGYGPSGPAGSRILQATAPPRHRVLIFSIKQAGAPAGGALAGVVAAQVAAQWGWQPALLTGMVLAAGAALIIQPLRAQLDAERNPRFRIREAFTLRRLAAPVTTLRLHPVLPPLTLQAFAFAALLGWAADRLGDAVRSLTIHGLCAAALAVLFVLAAPAAPWPVALGLALLCGFTSASWNGIFLAEVARVSPADRVAEASAGAIMLCFLGYLSAPSAFALAVMTTGSWTLPFLGAAGLLAAVSLFVLAWRAARGGAAG